MSVSLYDSVYAKQAEENRQYQELRGQISSDADDFMTEWKGNLAQSEDLYGKTQEAIDNYGQYESKLGDEYDLLEERFGGLRDKLTETAESDLEKRNIMGGMYMDAAKADYGGASSRAIGEVANQAQRGRQMQTRSDLARGMDPTSGSSKIARSKSYLDEAIGKVLAANAARGNEKLRAGAMAGRGMELFNPSHTANLALGIQNQGTGILTAQSNVAQNVAGMTNDLANSYTQNITKPAGDTAGSFYGLLAGMKPPESKGWFVGGSGGGSSSGSGDISAPIVREDDKYANSITTYGPTADEARDIGNKAQADDFAKNSSYSNANK